MTGVFRSELQRRLALAVTLVMLVWAASCRRTPEVSPQVLRDATVAFYTALAAIDTSQEVLAREQLDRVVTLVPHEPAGWANLGLLLLRQQEFEGARERLARAAELAPDAAAVVRLQALTEGRAGNGAASIDLWRRATELDPADLRGRFALAQELERQGGAEREAEAQRVLEDLLAQRDNLAARLEYARLAAKRGDTSALAKALGPLGAQSGDWPAAARERLAALQQAAGGDARAAATQVAFLRNVLAREAVFRRALAALTTPLEAVGEPLARFLVLPTPAPRPAAADTSMAFTVAPVPGWSEAVTTAAAVTLAVDANETVVAAGPNGVRTAPDRSLPAGGASRSVGAITPADLDYDFRTDLVTAGTQGLAVLRQDEHGAFTDITAGLGLSGEVTGSPVRSTWPADVDLDGDLDLVVAPEAGDAFVLRNNGDRTFARQQPFAPCAALRGFVWADVDGEGVPDAVCLEQGGGLRVFINVRAGMFEAAAAVPAAPAPLAAIVGHDADGDGRADVIGVTAGGALVALSLGDSDRAGGAAAWRWRELTRIDGAGTLNGDAVRLFAADLDNNAAADLIVSAASATRVVLAAADRTWSPLPGTIAIATHAVADLDADGRLELVGVGGDGRLAAARSQGTATYHWQRLRPRAATATGDQRINSFGIGGEMEVRTGLHVQTVPISSPIVHVGLGEARTSEVVRVIWPNGVLQSEFNAQADATIRTDQRLKGSCPWLFAWDGREMRFVTDLIWRSPLGLRINAQATADTSMTEDWVKVGGRQLAPRDGAYDLRITAELWETHFFDHVTLAVVDHPEGTEVFVDERFAVPGPALTPVVTSRLEPFAAVRDDTGRDVSGIVAQRDDVHLDFAGRGRYQGITRAHEIELTVPDEAPRTGPLYLVAQGWVHPTDSSVNVAISQGAHDAPRGLALAVADREGRFRTVREGLGFPAGKDKTVLIEIGSVLPSTGPRRLRLSTNLEIFWDRLAWAVGRPDVPVATHRQPMISADLRYRGFSVTTQKDASTPERPRYQVEGMAPRWLDLEGFHTRFGDVQPLLGGVDDRYVIMNAGDELALRFREAPAPAPGTVRDFVVIADGWVKDGDFNTTASRTVLPLPTHASGRYDRPATRLEDDPVYQQHRDDFATYHTRYVTPAARRALRRTDANTR